MLRGADGDHLRFRAERGLRPDSAVHRKDHRYYRYASREAPPIGLPTTPTPLPRDTKILSIGLHPGVLAYSRMPDGLEEAEFTTRIAAANAALREAGV